MLNIKGNLQTRIFHTPINLKPDRLSNSRIYVHFAFAVVAMMVRLSFVVFVV